MVMSRSTAIVTTLSLSAVFLLAGCVSVPHTDDRAMRTGNSTANLDVAGTQQELEARTNSLEQGWTEEQVFEALEIPKERFTKLRTDQKLPAIASNAQPQPKTAEEIQKIADFLDTLTVYQMPYTNIVKYGSIDLKLDVEKSETGFDRMLTLVFQDGTLRRGDFDGRPDFIEVKEDNLIWGGVNGIGDTAMRMIRP